MVEQIPNHIYYLNNQHHLRPKRLKSGGVWI